MSLLFKSDALRTLASVAAALVLSTTFVVAAVGPAKAAATVARVAATPTVY